MKTLRVKTAEGQFQPGWQFGTFKAYNCGGNLPASRHIQGWQLQSPDGCLRSCEGNWQQFVPFANQILENYGCVPDVS